MTAGEHVKARLEAVYSNSKKRAAWLIGRVRIQRVSQRSRSYTQALIVASGPPESVTVRVGLQIAALTMYPICTLWRMNQCLPHQDFRRELPRSFNYQNLTTSINNSIFLVISHLKRSTERITFDDQTRRRNRHYKFTGQLDVPKKHGYIHHITSLFLVSADIPLHTRRHR